MKYHLTVTDDEGEVVSSAELNLAEMRTRFGSLSTTLNDWGETSHDLAISKGFTSVDPKEKILLIHQELSELVEELRVDPRQSTKCPTITAEAEEVADAFLRLAQYAKMRGIDFDEAVDVKHAYNITRPHKHGKKF